MRPKRSVSWPKNERAEACAGDVDRGRDADLAGGDPMPLPFSVSREATEPTIVTSRPSRIQTVPRPMTTSQWKRDHGSRSSRAGISVSIVSAWAVSACAPAASLPCGTRFPISGDVCSGGVSAEKAAGTSEWCPDASSSSPVRPPVSDEPQPSALPVTATPSRCSPAARSGSRPPRARSRRLGGRALAIPVDVADAAGVEAAAERIERELGPIDVWVNNAMATVFAPFAETDG